MLFAIYMTLVFDNVCGKGLPSSYQIDLSSAPQDRCQRKSPLAIGTEKSRSDYLNDMNLLQKKEHVIHVWYQQMIIFMQDHLNPSSYIFMALLC